MKTAYFVTSFKMESMEERVASYEHSKQIFHIFETLNQQRLTSKLCDVILRISGIEISAHSNVLAAASPYFDTLFSGQELPRVFSQKTPQIVEILIEGDVDQRYGEAVQRVVDFMYTSQIDIDDTVLAQVTEIARIMQMWSIIDFCNLFQQGCMSVLKEETLDESTQTSNNICSDSTAENTALTKDGNIVKRKRGRPRKYPDTSDDSTTNKYTTVPFGIRVKQEDISGVVVKKEDTAVEKGVDSEPDKAAAETYEPVRVSKRGRLIKRKKFADEMVDEPNQSEVAKEGKTSLNANPGLDRDKTSLNPGLDREEQDVTEKLDDSDKSNGASEDKLLHLIIIPASENIQREDEKTANIVTMETHGDRAAVEEHTAGTAIEFVDAVSEEVSEAIVQDSLQDEMDDAADDTDIVADVGNVLLEDGIEEVVDEERVLHPLIRAADGDVIRAADGDMDEVIASERYQCDCCEFGTFSLKEFNDHHKIHLHAEKTCSYCGWVCDPENTSDNLLEEHLKNHTGPEPYFCNFCCARFKTRTKLYLHLPKHSLTKPFVCDVCQAGFKWKHALKNHMIVHKKTKDYLCDICGFATAHKTQLKAHHLIHTGETFKCTEPGCSYQATKRTNLKFHMLTHSNEKPHQCEICGTSFTLVKNMKRHMLLHKNDRPFRCDRCIFSTTRFDKLKDHYYKQHNIGDKPGKKFRLAEYLKYEAILDEMDERQDNDEKLGEEIETIELQVDGDGNTAGGTQVLNWTNSSGETIPIQITQQGLLYEIQQYPVQQVTQEVITS